MLTPVDADGMIVLPGYRTCGKSDCVSVSHIVTIKTTNERG
jgi:hypothetical protein